MSFHFKASPAAISFMKKVMPFVVTGISTAGTTIWVNYHNILSNRQEIKNNGEQLKLLEGKLGVMEGKIGVMEGKIEVMEGKFEGMKKEILFEFRQLRMDLKEYLK